MLSLRLPASPEFLWARRGDTEGSCTREYSAESPLGRIYNGGIEVWELAFPSFPEEEGETWSVCDPMKPPEGLGLYSG